MSDFTVQLITGTGKDALPVKSEALRYLGYKKNIPDNITDKLISECTSELMSVITPRCCYAFTDVIFIDEGILDIGFGEVHSSSLYSHLQGCKKAVLFAATVGIGADRLIAKYKRLSPAKSVVADALSSSAIESFCDTAEGIITQNIEMHCSRFSAGYGDFSLEYQRQFISVLDVSRKIGVALSDSLLMTPTKSVTAVIGIGANNRTCGSKCALCNNVTCLYRDRNEGNEGF